MPTPALPPTAPHRLADDTWLLPQFLPAGPDGFVPVSSMVITGAEPVLVDTGAPVHRAGWLEAAWSVVDPADVRWVFLSHDDVDHVGNLLEVLDLCPRATLVTDFFSVQRLAAVMSLPLHRLRWVNAGESFDVGDRTLTTLLPPLFDSPTTRGLFDASTGVLWAADCFAGPTPGPVESDDLAPGRFAETFLPFNSIAAPWHGWLHPAKYDRHVDGIQCLPIRTVASAHGPVLRGPAIDEAFALTRELATTPPLAQPGQPLLDQLLAASVPAQRSAGQPMPTA